jgi:hypothetical protein
MFQNEKKDCRNKTLHLYRKETYPAWSPRQNHASSQLSEFHPELFAGNNQVRSWLNSGSFTLTRPHV